MPAPLVECVPNFSEGCNAGTIGAILSAIRAVPGARLLDSSSDRDHNRTVVTIAGSPEAAAEAAFAAIGCAAERIDLRLHKGVHPRIGATDVVPFVPIRDISMEGCIALARALGRRAGDELNLPVYLYGEAAARPERKNLSSIRKGEFEALAAAIGTDPALQPDFGPARLGPAGATAIGARGPLIAFNIYLKTENLGIAKEVARRIRASSGGLPALQAMGVMAGGRAQVSMNLTDYTHTSIPQAYAAVRTEAGHLGVAIDCSELIGLIPQAACRDWRAAEVRLEDFSESMILECRLRQVGLIE
ncbi:MAG: glutamate formimidoyltransferase [Anaerolineales bacterium]